MNNGIVIFEKIKKLTKTTRVRAMNLNIEDNPNKEVIALYDAERAETEKGKMLAIIVNDKKEKSLRYKDAEDGFKNELRVKEQEYSNLIMRFRFEKSKLKRFADSEIKEVESPYYKKNNDDRIEEERDNNERTGFFDRITNAIIDKMKLNDDEYEDEEDYEYEDEYDDEYDDDFSLTETLKGMVDKAKGFTERIKGIKTVGARDNSKIIYLSQRAPKSYKDDRDEGR